MAGNADCVLDSVAHQVLAHDLGAGEALGSTFARGGMPRRMVLNGHVHTSAA